MLSWETLRTDIGLDLSAVLRLQALYWFLWCYLVLFTNKFIKLGKRRNEAFMWKRRWQPVVAGYTDLCRSLQCSHWPTHQFCMIELGLYACMHGSFQIIWILFFALPLQYGVAQSHKPRQLSLSAGTGIFRHFLQYMPLSSINPDNIILLHKQAI